MAKPNYNFEKRQRELKKNKKQEEKRLKKQSRAVTPGEDTDTAAVAADSTEERARE
ncbi:MAG: hypothetical protein WC809_13800 [Sinimarinibacterium sp.]|jgi:hypothetical protein